jgi:hypothetical protein
VLQRRLALAVILEVLKRPAFSTQRAGDGLLVDNLVLGEVLHALGMEVIPTSEPAPRQGLVPANLILANGAVVGAFVVDHLPRHEAVVNAAIFLCLPLRLDLAPLAASQR